MPFIVDDAILIASAATAAANTGVGIFSSITGNKAQDAQYAQEMQNWKDQKRFQRVSDQFANWQARFNAELSNTNSKYRYWAETVNYNQQKSYVNALRNTEKIKAIRQAEVVYQTRANAMGSYVSNSQALSQQFEEMEMQDAVALQQYNWRSLQARASVQALEQEGISVDRIVNDYSRQQGDYASLQQINKGLRTRQYTRAQAGQIAQYLERWNSQQFYDEQRYQDPLPPLAPLPTLVMPQPPSMTGAAPTRPANNLGLNIANDVLGGINAGLNMYSGLGGLKTPGSPTGSGTPKGTGG